MTQESRMSEEKPSKSVGLSTKDKHADLFEETHHDAVDVFRSGSIMEDSWTDGEASSDDKLIALLCYWTQIFMPFVMPIIVLLSESGKRRTFQRFHALQSLGVVLGSMIASVGLIMMSLFVIGPFALCLVPLAYAMSIIALVIYGWQGLKGRRFAVPFLSRWMKEQGWL